jgi:hypothetical protein
VEAKISPPKRLFSNFGGATTGTFTTEVASIPVVGEDVIPFCVKILLTSVRHAFTAIQLVVSVYSVALTSS